MKLESHQSAEDKRRWKIVRKDNFADLEGSILEADEETGECKMEVNGESKSFSFGAGGLRIVRRAH